MVCHFASCSGKEYNFNEHSVKDLMQTDSPHIHQLQLHLKRVKMMMVCKAIDHTRHHLLLYSQHCNTLVVQYMVTAIQWHGLQCKQCHVNQAIRCGIAFNACFAVARCSIAGWTIERTKAKAASTNNAFTPWMFLQRCSTAQTLLPAASPVISATWKSRSLGCENQMLRVSLWQAIKMYHTSNTYCKCQTQNTSNGVDTGLTALTSMPVSRCNNKQPRLMTSATLLLASSSSCMPANSANLIPGMTHSSHGCVCGCCRCVQDWVQYRKILFTGKHWTISFACSSTNYFFAPSGRVPEEGQRGNPSSQVHSR